MNERQILKAGKKIIKAHLSTIQTLHAMEVGAGKPIYQNEIKIEADELDTELRNLIPSIKTTTTDDLKYYDIIIGSHNAREIAALKEQVKKEKGNSVRDGTP